MTLTAPYLVDVADRPPGGLHVTAILPTLNPYGGVLSVVNLLEELKHRGHRYTLASLSQITKDVLNLTAEPVYVASRPRLGHVLPPTADVIIATSWETVFPAIELARRTPRASVWYFIQGIDTDFTDAVHHDRIRATYAMIENRVVKTAHLQQQLRDDFGVHAHRIRPGMNLDIFYPRDVPADDVLRVLAMARPDAPEDHRGWQVVREVFAGLAERRPEVELHLFGTDKLPRLPFPVVDHGRVDPKGLPAVYSRADVFADLSRTHGFGRTGVEAMACGTPVVLSRSGGPDEYAEHERNALMVDVADVDGSVAAIERLLDDRELAGRLATEALLAVQPYAEGNAADEMVALWLEDLARIRGGDHGFVADPWAAAGEQRPNPMAVARSAGRR